MILRKPNREVIDGFVINAKNVGKFKLLHTDEIRKQRFPKVKSMAESLRSGKNFHAPLVVEKYGRDYLDVDGYHRLSAIQMVIDEDPEFEIEVSLYVYPQSPNLDGRCELFNNWNAGTPQSTDDYLKMYSGSIPHWNRLNLPEFKAIVIPTIYPADGELHFRKWTGAYLASTLFRPSGLTMSNRQFVFELTKLNEQDYETMKDMVKDIYANIPNVFTRGVRQANTTGVASLVYVYYHMVCMGHVRKSDFWAAYNKVNSDYEDKLRYTGGAATKDAIVELDKQINKHLSGQYSVPLTR